MTQPFGRYDVLWSAENKYQPRPLASVDMCYLLHKTYRPHGCPIIAYYFHKNKRSVISTELHIDIRSFLFLFISLVSFAQ